MSKPKDDLISKTFHLRDFEIFDENIDTLDLLEEYVAVCFEAKNIAIKLKMCGL